MLKTIFSLFFIFGSTSIYAAACTIDANGKVTNDVNAFTAGDENGCSVTPDYAYLPVYRVGLCSSVPTYENYLTECTFLFNKATATEVEVAKGQSFNMVDSVTLTEGSYPAAVLLLGTTIGYKHTVNFTTLQDGWSDAGTATEGKTCVSRTVSGNVDDIGGSAGGGFYECGANTLTAGKFTENQGAYWDNSTCSISAGVVSRTSATSNYMDYTTASNDGIVICGMLNESTHENGGNGTGTTNATRQLVIQTFANPLTITPTISSMQVGLKLTDQLALEKHMHNGSGYYNAFLDGVQVKITVE